MSDRDPRYNPVELLIKATDADTETAAERSALHNFHKLAEELRAEEQKRDSFVEHSTVTAKLQPAMQDHLNSQANSCVIKIKQLRSQLQQMAGFDVLESVAWRVYRKICEDDLALFRKQETERFEQQLQETREDYERKRQRRLQNQQKTMPSYDESYESYKKELLQSQYFTEQLKQKYTSTLHDEKDFINKNGVLDKIGILSAICGLCFGFFFSLGETTNITSIILRCVLAVAGIACAIFAMSIASDYKSASGKSNFYSFVYNRYIADQVRKDRQKETDSLLRDMLKKMDSTEFNERYEHLSMYDRFERDIAEDYNFSKSIHDHIK